MRTLSKSWSLPYSPPSPTTIHALSCILFPPPRSFGNSPRLQIAPKGCCDRGKHRRPTFLLRHMPSQIIEEPYARALRHHDRARLTTSNLARGCKPYTPIPGQQSRNCLFIGGAWANHYIPACQISLSLRLT